MGLYAFGNIAVSLNLLSGSNFHFSYEDFPVVEQHLLCSSERFQCFLMILSTLEHFSEDDLGVYLQTTIKDSLWHFY